ncbi:MAG TPA: hypothetical protein VM290_07695 [Gaiellaceae bacterium]|nr:hypothetical protein [Gaiellaceae bacterium]
MEPTGDNLRAWDEAHQREATRDGLPAAVRERLPELDGRHVLQLGGGADAAAELVERGAVLTVVVDDVGAGHDTAPTAAWIRGDPHALPLELQRGRFHLVLAHADAVRDPRAWGRGVEAALRPGGYVLAFGTHPAGAALDPMLRWRRDYFGGAAPTLGALVTGLARAGLVVRRLEELRALEPQRRATPFPGAFVVVAARPLA